MTFFFEIKYLWIKSIQPIQRLISLPINFCALIFSCCSSCSIQPEPMMLVQTLMEASLFALMMSQKSSLSKSHLLLSSSLICSSCLTSVNSSVNLLYFSIKWSSFSCLLSGFDKKSLKLDFISSSLAMMQSFFLLTDLNKFVMLLAY